MKIYLTFALILIAFTSNSQNIKYTLGQTASFLEYGQYRGVSDPYVIEVGKLLKSLSTKYGDTEYNILDWTQKAFFMLKKDGVNQSMVLLMKEVNDTERIQKTPYKDMIGLYAYMLEKAK
jgi:hypothetical protein